MSQDTGVVGGPEPTGQVPSPGCAAGPGAEATGPVLALRDALADLHLPYALAGTSGTSARADLVRDQLGDYVLPRLASIDAPLLAVVGGSTGAGKSTLVSSLVRRHVAASSAIRPTTRRPLLLHAPGDGPWFEGERVLGSLARVRISADAPPTPPTASTPRELEVRTCATLPEGLALLDAPDVDSVVEENRNLAATLLAGADLWVFVTTASRYADAVPWAHLRAAAARDIVIAVVLDRVPQGAGTDVENDLRRRLNEAGLVSAPVFSVPETPLETDGFLPDGVVAPLRQWLGGLATDAQARREVARRTLSGALGAALAETSMLAAELDAQSLERDDLAGAASAAHDEALARVDQAVADGSMLRGEVLARWQEFVGTGDFLRGLEAQVGRLRDRLSAAVRGAPAPAVKVEEAIESSLASLLVAEAQRAGLETERSWRRAGTAPYQLTSALGALRQDEELTHLAVSTVREWQGDVLGMIRAEGSDKRLTARILSFGVNGIGVALMVLVFAHTGGLTGGEVGIAGGTAVLAQRLLEAVFGDQAMRTMAERARADLMGRARALLEDQEKVFTDVLPEPVPTGPELRRDVERARAGTQGILGGGAGTGTTESTGYGSVPGASAYGRVSQESAR